MSNMDEWNWTLESSHSDGLQDPPSWPWWQEGLFLRPPRAGCQPWPPATEYWGWKNRASSSSSRGGETQTVSLSKQCPFCSSSFSPKFSLSLSSWSYTNSLKSQMDLKLGSCRRPPLEQFHDQQLTCWCRGACVAPPLMRISSLLPAPRSRPTLVHSSMQAVVLVTTRALLRRQSPYLKLRLKVYARHAAAAWITNAEHLQEHNSTAGLIMPRLWQNN